MNKKVVGTVLGIFSLALASYALTACSPSVEVNQPEEEEDGRVYSSVTTFTEEKNEFFLQGASVGKVVEGTESEVRFSLLMKKEKWETIKNSDGLETGVLLVAKDSLNGTLTYETATSKSYPITVEWKASAESGYMENFAYFSKVPQDCYGVEYAAVGYYKTSDGYAYTQKAEFSPAQIAKNAKDKGESGFENYYTFRLTLDGIEQNDGIIYGEKLQKPANPQEKSGYQWSGKWLLGEREWNFDVDTVKGNIALKSEMVKQYLYTVTFNTNGGQAIQSVQVKKGEKVQKPSLSTKQDEIYDYELKSWQKESSEWNFETDVVTEDITLVAVWEIVATRKQFLPK